MTAGRRKRSLKGAVLPLLALGLVVGSLLPNPLPALAALDEAAHGWLGRLALGLLIAIAGLLLGLLRQRNWLKTSLRAQEAAAPRVMQTDPLTGLPHRAAFRTAVAEALAAGDAAVVVIDFSGFRTVNELLGTEAGDRLLLLVAERLQGAMAPETTILARLGDTEFAALTAPGKGPDEVAACAARGLAALAQLHELDGQPVELGGCAGIAMAPSHAATAPGLLRAAHFALAEAQRAGIGRIRFYDRVAGEQVREDAGLRWELRGALARGEVVPYYQPLLNLASRRIVGVEVLARWEHPRLGLLLPKRFMAMAESMRLMGDMTLVLVRQACLDAQDWPETWRIAFNVSPDQLNDPAALAAAVGMLREANIAAARIEVEITESGLIEDLPAARLVLNQLHQLGVSVALDDFGSGFSSLHHLRELPFDKIKIDRSFVATVLDDPRSAAYVKAIVGLGRSLSVPTTAEGIEVPAVMEAVAALGCTFGQGNMISPPKPAAELMALMALA